MRQLVHPIVFRIKRFGIIPTRSPNGDVECRAYEKIAIFDQYLALSRK